MDRLAAHVVATAVLTAALAAVPTAMANPIVSDPSPKPTVTTTTTAATATPTAKPASPAPSASPSVSPSKSPSASASASASAPASPAAPARPTPPPATRNTPEPIPCPDVRQIGGTSYARWHSVVAFSVKLFYSAKCHELYGYAFPWLQFRTLNVHYDLGMGVFDVTHDAIDGARTFLSGAGGPDFWSSPVGLPAGTCTEGLAHVFFPDTETDTFTAKVCV